MVRMCGIYNVLGKLSHLSTGVLLWPEEAMNNMANKHPHLKDEDWQEFHEIFSVFAHSPQNPDWNVLFPPDRKYSS